MSDRDPADRTPTPPSTPEASQVAESPDTTSTEDREHLRKIQRERRARVIKAVIVVGLLVLLIVFVLRNSGRVPIDFVFFTRQARLIWVLVVTTLLGGIIGYLLGRPSKKLKLHDDPKHRKQQR